MLQTAIVVVEPKRANGVLVALSEAKATVVSVVPIQTGAITEGDDLLVTFTVEHESADAQYAFLTWLEDTLGTHCEAY